MSVFIIDDDIFYTSLIEKQLENCGDDEIHTYHSMEPALNDLEKLKPQLLFMDIHLKDINALNYLERIKKMRPKTSVIVMTADDRKDLQIECKEKGAFYFLNKSKNLFKELKQIIEEVNSYNTFFS